MNILVCTKLSLPEAGRCLPDWRAAEDMGHRVWCTYMGGTPKEFVPDVALGMGVGAMNETYAAIERWPGVPLYCYNWDCYEWVWSDPRPGEYDYHRYGGLLSCAREVWVPSACTRHRTMQWWHLDSRVILSSCPWWDCGDVRDEGYILCTLRKIPDICWEMFEQACQKLALPYRMTNHGCSYADYQREVAHCRFLVSHLHEASTGGLSLLEGYYLGKPCLLSDSAWHGGVDYLKDRATYFSSGNMSDLGTKLRAMYDDPPVINREAASRWVADTFSDKRMVSMMIKRISACAV